MPANPEFCCPRCGRNACRVLRLPHPVLLIWLLNPLVVFFEVLLGVRIARVIYVCIGCDRALEHRQYGRCRQCARFHPSNLWGGRYLFGHWFGMFCPDCGGRIPAMPNILSCLVMAALAPLWWPVWKWIGPRWVEREQRRARGAAAVCFSRGVPRWRIWTPVTLGILCGVICVIARHRPEIRNSSWIELGVPVGIGLILAAILGWLLEKFLKRQPRYQPGRCRNCGYELQGLPTQVCPECGYHFSPDDQVKE